MKVIVHVSSDPDCPEHLRFIAHLLDGKEFLPVRFHGRTAAEAEKRAEDQWEADKAKALGRKV